MRDGDPRLRRFADFLARAGLKATRQRTQIVRAFFGAGQHLSAEALYRQIYARAPDIGLVTVYRTLKLLQEAGLATAHQFGESFARFDPSPADRPHSHLICTRCGKIQEFRDRGLRHLRQKVARGYGFAVGECKLERLLRTITDGPTRSITVLAREREVSAEIVSRMGQEPVRLLCTIPSASRPRRARPPGRGIFPSLLAARQVGMEMPSGTAGA